MGQKVWVVPGDARNIKITTAADLAVAAAIIDTLSGAMVAPSGEP
jgi:2-C-methyl-D-erythritol 4-phosphate cytidylyltransferase